MHSLPPDTPHAVLSHVSDPFCDVSRLAMPPGDPNLFKIHMDVHLSFLLEEFEKLQVF